MNPEYVGWDVVTLVGLVSVMMLVAYIIGVAVGRQDRDRRITERERDEAEAELVRLGGGVLEAAERQERRVM
ncbi:MAG TPA: hypothetical protein VF981_13595 [Gemmatimonadaceae bacterium]